MLQVKNLKKEYMTKKGVVTKALDDVSLTFPETGMIFVLGKSGSGKSTLLNVCGGLDRADSGEIIIKGKSSAEFSAQDFDSYRNTYVGFVFQEYNILDEFTIEENIALALELQNKKRDKAVIDKILADVDMTDFAARRPNTLSGGQKQRVAIARALVKQPEIIMADEPTGALDSATGQQVFDTLKKLSEHKLVIVVSHDRDFAEQYGDRIIELKDGKVISDQTREGSEVKTKNVRFFGADTVCVNNGAEITDEDLQNIKTFLMRSNGVVISSSRERIDEMKRDLPELKVGKFEDIKDQPVSKEYPPQQLIRSHLPARHAFRMGANGLSTKPVRLVFTLLLSIIAFIMFGIASTLMLFDGRKVTVQTLQASNDSRIVIAKAYYEKQKIYSGEKLMYSFENLNQTFYTYEEYKAFCEKYEGAVAAVNDEVEIENITDMSYYAQQFYSASIDGYIIADPSLKLLAGRLPEADDEVAISDYIFDGLKTENAKLIYTKPDGTEAAVTLTDHKSVLYSAETPVTLDMHDTRFKIVGVFECDELPSAYNKLKQAAELNTPFSGDSMTMYQWRETREAGMYGRLAVTIEFVQKYAGNGAAAFMNEYDYFKSSYTNTFIGLETGDSENNIGDIDNNLISSVATYSTDEGAKHLPLYDVNGNTVTEVGNGKAAVHAGTLARMYLQYLNGYIESAEVEPEYDEEVIDGLYELAWWIYGPINATHAINVFGKAEEYMREWDLSFDLKVRCESSGDVLPVEICGFFVELNRSCCYFGQDIFGKTYVATDDWRTEYETKYTAPDDAFISAIFIPFDSGRTLGFVDKVVKLTDLRASDDSTTILLNPVMSDLEFIITLAGMLGTVFLVMGIVFAIFAFLLMFNFISASISAKKKEIGILRAIGARTVDVFKIYLSEAAIIALICIVVSTLGTFGLCYALNSVFISGTMLNVAVFVFGIWSFLCIVAVALVTATIATVIPVALYSRKPPVESIRAL